LCIYTTSLKETCQAGGQRKVEDWRNKQIAGQIQTSEATVKVHRTNLMRKMQASSLADLIVMLGRLSSSDKTSNAPNGSKAL